MNAFTNKVDEEIWLERNASEFFSGGAPFESRPGLSCLSLFCSFPQFLQFLKLGTALFLSTSLPIHYPQFIPFDAVC
jgi:hypothetical protein